MRLRQLEYFVAICEAGSFTAAAERLLVAQPSLSQQIKALEQELGCTLLERSRNGVTPTTAGRVFLKGARATLEAGQAAQTSVRRFAHARPAEVEIITLRSIASGILVRSLTPWAAHHPDTVVRLRDFSHRRTLEEHARKGEGHLAVGPRPETWSGPVRTLGYEEMRLVFPTAAGPAFDPEELSRLDWVLYEPRNGLTEVIDVFCERYGISATPRARTDQADLAFQMALDGLGVAIVPQHVIPLDSEGRTGPAGDGLFRAVTVYSRRPPEGLPAEYLQLLAGLDLGLRSAEAIPSGAIVI